LNDGERDLSQFLKRHSIMNSDSNNHDQPDPTDPQDDESNFIQDEDGQDIWNGPLADMAAVGASPARNDDAMYGGGTDTIPPPSKHDKLFQPDDPEPGKEPEPDPDDRT
jgi:hypothetical protein